MPDTTTQAAAELRQAIKDKSLTARAIALHIGKNEAWMSRRLSATVALTIDDYRLIQTAIEALQDKTIGSKS